MQLIAKGFTFDGRTLDKKLMLGTFDSLDELTETAITYKTNVGDITPYRPTPNYYNRGYKDLLTFDVVIVKCNGEAFSRKEREDLIKWLTSPLSPTLFTVIDFEDDDYHKDIEYNVVCIEFQEYRNDKEIIGLKFQFQNDSPYPTTPTIKTHIHGTGSVIVNNTSDELYENYYPILHLSAHEDGEVTISNKRFSNETMILKMKNGQTLNIDNYLGDITDNFGIFNYDRDTNLVWLKLASGENEIKITGNVTGYILCRYVRKVGI